MEIFKRSISIDNSTMNGVRTGVILVSDGFQWVISGGTFGSTFIQSDVRTVIMHICEVCFVGAAGMRTRTLSKSSMGASSRICVPNSVIIHYQYRKELQVL